MPTDEQIEVHERRDELAERVAPRPSPPAGQLGTFAVLGAAAGTVPLPWVPDALTRRVRGALVQDIAARHGLSLSREARRVLSSPASAKTKKGALGEALTYIGRKVLVRFGPLAVLPPLRAGLETFALGHLFHRYLSRARRLTGRIEEREATVLVDTIERAVIRVASPERGLEWKAAPTSPEDSRDELTQVVDGLLTATATVPSWLLRRLDLAFDEVLASDGRAGR